MAGKDISRVLLAVVVAYGANVLLVGATEKVLLRIFSGPLATLPSHYFVIDLVSQGILELPVGYICCWIAGPTRSAALVILIALGLAVGTISVAFSWRTEPHWYAITLLLAWSPCVWLGWLARMRCSRV